jgi:phosphoserine aminotransferase
MSGYWGLWAYQQAIIAGARVSAISPMSQTEGFDGLYYCDNETLSGARYKIQRNSMTQWLVVDKTSSLLTAPFDKNEELPDLIIAACQKNLGFSGASLVIAHRRVLTDSQASSLRLPPLDYQLQSHIQNDPCTPSLLHFWTIDAIVDWIQEQGGLQAIDNKRSYWAGKIYQIIDKSPWLINRIPTDHRSTINITFDLTLEAQQRQAELDTALQHVGCYAFRGHPAYAPGYRLSLYNTIACLDLSAVCQVLEDF